MAQNNFTLQGALTRLQFLPACAQSCHKQKLRKFGSFTATMYADKAGKLEEAVLLQNLENELSQLWLWGGGRGGGCLQCTLLD